jgi:hypothetical protein
MLYLSNSNTYDARYKLRLTTRDSSNHNNNNVQVRLAGSSEYTGIQVPLFVVKELIQSTAQCHEGIYKEGIYKGSMEHFTDWNLLTGNLD